MTKAKLIKTELGYQLFDENMKYITSLGTKGLSLKNCKAIENGYDLDDLAHEIYMNLDEQDISVDYDQQIRIMVLSMQKALEILDDKKFSEDDMVNCYYEGKDGDWGSAGGYIDSLQNTEWDVTFNSDERDLNGCLILKIV